jgi:hypothetical protein
MQILSYSNQLNINLAISIVFLLTGCASTQEKNQQVVADVKIKYQRLINEQPILYLLEDKIRLPPQKNWTTSQLADHSFANESQKEAIAVYDRIATETNEALLGMANKRDEKGEAAIFSDWVNASKENRLALYEGNISFGVFNQNSKTLDQAMLSLSKKLGHVPPEKAHSVWTIVFKSWGESLKINQAVTENCYGSGDELPCSSNQE